MPKRPLSLNEHDPWETRLALVFLGLTGIVGAVSAIILKLSGQDAEGFIAIPVAVIMAFNSVLSRRPPWSARRGTGEGANLKQSGDGGT